MTNADTSTTVTVTEVAPEQSTVAAAVFAESLASNADQGSVHCAAILSSRSPCYIAAPSHSAALHLHQTTITNISVFIPFISVQFNLLHLKRMHFII